MFFGLKVTKMAIFIKTAELYKKRSQAGADLGVSRGAGADFQKHFEFWKKQSKKGVFWKC